MLTLKFTAKSLIFLSLLASITLGACEERASDVQNSDSVSSPLPDTKVSPPSNSSTEDPRDAVPSAQTAIALSGNGLLLIDENSGRSTPLGFKTPETEAKAAISNLLGEPTAIAQNDECGAGPMRFITWANGMSINILNDQFAGWTVRPETESAALTTVDGIGLGASLSELKSAYETEVFESSLGIEFNAASSLFGLLSANAPEGEITNLWSGYACNFR